MSVVPHSQPAVSVPEKELSASYHEDICHAPVTYTDMDYEFSYKDQYHSLSAVALDPVLAPASQAYSERIFSVCDNLTAGKRNYTQAALKCRVFSKSNMKYLWGLLTVNWQTE